MDGAFARLLEDTPLQPLVEGASVFSGEGLLSFLVEAINDVATAREESDAAIVNQLFARNGIDQEVLPNSEENIPRLRELPGFPKTFVGSDDAEISKNLDMHDGIDGAFTKPPLQGVPYDAKHCESTVGKNCIRFDILQDGGDRYYGGWITAPRSQYCVYYAEREHYYIFPLAPIRREIAQTIASDLDIEFPVSSLSKETIGNHPALQKLIEFGYENGEVLPGKGDPMTDRIGFHVHSRDGEETYPICICIPVDRVKALCGDRFIDLRMPTEEEIRKREEEKRAKEESDDAALRQRFDAEKSEGVDDAKRKVSEFVASANGVEWNTAIKYFVYAGTENRISSNDLPKEAADAYYLLVTRLDDFAIPDTLDALVKNLSALLGRQMGIAEVDRMLQRDCNTRNFIEVWHHFLKDRGFKDCPIDPAFHFVDFMRGWSAYIDGGGRLTKIPSMYRKRKPRLGF